MNIKGTIFDIDYPCRIKYKGYTFRNAQAIYQSSKCPSRIEEFVNLNPQEAKELGRKVFLRDDWEERKYHEMYGVMLAKFIPNDYSKNTQTLDFFNKLLETWPEEIIYNDEDFYWGCINGSGENKLGKILEDIRDEYYIPF